MHGNHLETDHHHQIPKWINLNCEPPPSVYHPSHSDHVARTLTHYIVGLARFFLQTEIGYVGNADL